MTGLANLLFASLFAAGMFPLVTATNPTVGARANGQPASIPQAATQDQQQSPAKSASPRPNPDASGKYHAGEGVTLPKLIYSVQPEFSEKLRKKKIPGSCVVGLTVDIDGNPKDVHVVSSMPGLEDKKLRAAVIELQDSCTKPVKQYRFEPGTFHGNLCRSN
jgi:Gram-negative bacterial TonB protein C-terminal